jgi:hypothetical protein
MTKEANIQTTRYLHTATPALRIKFNSVGQEIRSSFGIRIFTAAIIMADHAKLS